MVQRAYSHSEFEKTNLHDNGSNEQANEESAPFLLRCGALLFDYTLFIVFPVGGMLIGRLLGYDGSRLISSDINNFAWLFGILIAAADLILLPIGTRQTLGKMLTGIEIVRYDGGKLATKAIILRQTVGYLLIIFTFGIGFLIAAITPGGRALHDFLFGTRVVRLRGKI
ncbi:MAG TPA: RDD family protein [Pyrinomonadaceae bacterium]|nr:RDD family protein [Pyrinomonadaceae bacterium]